MDYPYKVAKNDNDKAGELAGKKFLFGFCSRYAVAPVHTRFDQVQWFVWDAELITCSDYLNGLRPPVIRQSDSFEHAVAGL